MLKALLHIHYARYADYLKRRPDRSMVECKIVADFEDGTKTHRQKVFKFVGLPKNIEECVGKLSEHERNMSERLFESLRSSHTEELSTHPDMLDNDRIIKLLTC